MLDTHSLYMDADYVPSQQQDHQNFPSRSSHMAVMEDEKASSDQEAFEKLTISDTTDVNPSEDSEPQSKKPSNVPPTSPTATLSQPPTQTTKQQSREQPRSIPSNQQYGYAPMSGQPRNQTMAPRQLPPYVCSTTPGRSFNQANRGGTGWGGMPLSPRQNERASGTAAGNGSLHDQDAPSSLTEGTAVNGSEAGSVSSADQGGAVGGQRKSSRNAVRPACAFFLKTGSCAYGDRCKFDHPYDRAPQVVYNSIGLPMRPDEPPCAFYMKHWHCAFGHTCRYHHPEPPAQAAMVPPAAAAVPVTATATAAPPQQLLYSPTPMMAAAAHQYYSAMQMQQQQQMGRMAPMAYYQPRMAAMPGTPAGPAAMYGFPAAPGMAAPMPTAMYQPPTAGARRQDSHDSGGGRRSYNNNQQHSPQHQQMYKQKPLMVFNSPNKSTLMSEHASH